jgi:hypothetical protein
MSTKAIEAPTNHQPTQEELVQIIFKTTDDFKWKLKQRAATRHLSLQDLILTYVTLGYEQDISSSHK